VPGARGQAQQEGGAQERSANVKKSVHEIIAGLLQPNRRSQMVNVDSQASRPLNFGETARFISNQGVMSLTRINKSGIG
jgi:hypothetical protein